MYNIPNYNFNYPWNQTPAQPQPSTSGINWVQGEAGAKSYAIAPNQSVLLMDSENNVFYIKSSDASGMPMPLRIFDYTERVTAVKNDQVTPIEKIDYVTRDEFNKVIAELRNGKQHIQSTKQQQQ